MVMVEKGLSDAEASATFYLVVISLDGIFLP